MPDKVYLLEPCPFCNSKDVAVRETGKGNGFVRCDNCKAFGPDEQEPYDMWNSVQREKKNEKA